MSELRCANCGFSDELAEKIITGGYLDEDEWVCSDNCYDELIEKGCPLEKGGHYRAYKSMQRKISTEIEEKDHDEEWKNVRDAYSGEREEE